MPAIGGSIREISLNGRVMAVASDASAATKLGGFSNEIRTNGNRTARMIKTFMPFSITGLTVEVDVDRGDFEFLQSLSDSLDFFTITVTLVGGQVYQGNGSIVGDLEYSNDSATASVDLSGTGGLSLQ